MLTICSPAPDFYRDPIPSHTISQCWWSEWDIDNAGHSGLRLGSRSGAPVAVLPQRAVRASDFNRNIDANVGLSDCQHRRSILCLMRSFQTALMYATDATMLTGASLNAPA